MLIKATCNNCGNTDVTKFKYYDGLLGYEAHVCEICGTYVDHTGVHVPDEWSLHYIGKGGK